MCADGIRRRRKNNDVGESLGNKFVCRKNENLSRNQHTRDYSHVEISLMTVNETIKAIKMMPPI